MMKMFALFLLLLVVSSSYAAISASNFQEDVVVDIDDDDGNSVDRELASLAAQIVACTVGCGDTKRSDFSACRVTGSNSLCFINAENKHQRCFDTCRNKSQCYKKQCFRKLTKKHKCLKNCNKTKNNKTKYDKALCQRDKCHRPKQATLNTCYQNCSKKSINQKCGGDADCRSNSCGLKRVGGTTPICCSSAGKTDDGVCINKLRKVNAKCWNDGDCKSSYCGTECVGAPSKICCDDQGVASSGVCVSEQLDTGEECEASGDCLSSRCALGEDDSTSVCCDEFGVIAYSDPPKCFDTWDEYLYLEGDSCEDSRQCEGGACGYSTSISSDTVCCDDDGMVYVSSLGRYVCVSGVLRPDGFHCISDAQCLNQACGLGYPDRSADTICCNEEGKEFVNEFDNELINYWVCIDQVDQDEIDAMNYGFYETGI